MKHILFILAIIVLSSFMEDTKYCWVNVPDGFKDRHNYYKKGVNTLVVVVDTSGKEYVSCNSLNEFPELFDTLSNLKFEWLAPEAFPVDSTDWD